MRGAVLAAPAALALAACNLAFPDRTDGDTGTDAIADAPDGDDGTDVTGDPDLEVTPDDWDGDTIPNEAEGCVGTGDVNGDTLVDEADYRDTDGDGVPDCEDLDSDGDCVPDPVERASGTDQTELDSDADGACDLVEWALGTDPLAAADNPAANGDYAFVMHHHGAPDPGTATLVLTDLRAQSLDVFFLLDVTGSMSQEAGVLSDGFLGFLVPGIRTTAADSAFGVGVFGDYPMTPYGEGTDEIFGLASSMTSSEVEVDTALHAMPSMVGGDSPEGAVPALWATATGNGLGSYLDVQGACPEGTDGYACFRPYALPLIVLITDAELHNGPAGYAPYAGIDPAPPTYDDTIAAVNSMHGKVAAYVTSGFADTAFTQCESIAVDTGTVTDSGDPIAMFADTSPGYMLEDLDTLIQDVVYIVPFDVTVRVTDDNSDSVDAVAAFVDGAEANGAGGVPAPENPGMSCAAGLSPVDTDSDGHPDTFVAVGPGAHLCFDLAIRQNATVEGAAGAPTVYTAFAEAVGNGRYWLAMRDLHFVVPPLECDP